MSKRLDPWRMSDALKALLADSVPGFSFPAAVCELCGVLTQEWWFFDGKRGVCRCSACYKAGVYAK